MNTDKKIVITVLGSTGMLGNAVCNELNRSTHNDNTVIISSYRNVNIGNNVDSDAKIYVDPLSHRTIENIPDETDYVINCIGTIKPFMNSNMADSIYINSVFPHKLSDYCNSKCMKLIHITTDCVFSGKNGPYNENSPHDEVDMYGKSKSLGESKSCMVLRTSIIGPEIHKNASLVAWVKSCDGKSIAGYTNHLWNGITTKQYAKICRKIISDNMYERGLFHVFSPNDVNKHDLVKMIAEKYSISIDITPTECKDAIDRRLDTVKELNKKLSIPNLKTQIGEM